MKAYKGVEGRREGGVEEAKRVKRWRKGGGRGVQGGRRLKGGRDGRGREVKDGTD